MELSNAMVSAAMGLLTSTLDRIRNMAFTWKDFFQIKGFFRVKDFPKNDFLPIKNFHPKNFDSDKDFLPK